MPIDTVDKIWMDGELVAWDDAKVHVLTHTLHYGLGGFEGIRAYKRGDGKSAAAMVQGGCAQVRFAFPRAGRGAADCTGAHRVRRARPTC